MISAVIRIAAGLSSIERACNGRYSATRRGCIYSLSVCSSGGSLLIPTRCGSAAVWCTVVHMGGWTNGRTSVVGCCLVHAHPSFSPRLFLLSCLLQPLHSHLSFFHLSLIISFRPVLLSFVLFLLDTSLKYITFLALARIFRLPPVLHLFLFSSSRGICLLEGPELAGGHYGGYSVGFSRLSKAHERVCPPEGQGTPSGTGSPPSLPLFTSSLSTSLPLSFSFPLSSLRHVPPPTHPMPPPVRTLGFYLFSFITAVGM